MSLGDALAFAAVALPILGAGAWQSWDYQFAHKPMAQAMWAWVEYDKCCENTRTAQLAVCKKLGVPEDECPIDLSQCDRYKEKD